MAAFSDIDADAMLNHFHLSYHPSRAMGTLATGFSIIFLPDSINAENLTWCIYRHHTPWAVFLLPLAMAKKHTSLGSDKELMCL